MSGDAALALQQALYGRLSGDATLAGLVSGVFDHVPDETAFPYVTVGEDAATDWSTKTFDGQRHALTVHVWSRARGRTEAKTIMARLYALLHGATFAMAGHELILLRCDFSETRREPDGLTQHGVMRFRALTHSNS